ncbi:MAG: elongation factor G [Candidatus Eisenbacteria bacterium]|nr:elongation factor G [Candidatus Eisenbacteria bacterium]
MKSPSPDKIRNVALLAHGSAGKTMLAEAMLFAGGAISRMGSVDDGSSALDYSETERKRQITVNLGVGHFEWKGSKVNVLDCPGYADFYGDVKAGIRVSDSGVVLMAAPSGVEVGTELVWQFLESAGLPRMICVNKMDKEHADYRKCLDQASEMLGARPAPVTIPIGSADGFKGVVDLIEEKAYVYDGSGKASVEEVPADMAEEVAELRTQLIEAAAENDEQLMEKFFGEEQLSPDEIRQGLRVGVAQATITPVVATVATSSAGVEQLMDLIVSVMPSAAAVKEAKGAKPDSEDEEVAIPAEAGSPFSALVFKTVAEQHVGELSLFRVYSGSVGAGSDVLNSNQGEGERMGTVYALVGRERKDMEQVSVGDIGAVVKLKVTSTGDTLCAKAKPIVLPSIEFPKAVLSVAVRAKSKGDEEKISQALQKLQEEDPTFTAAFDPVIKQTIVSGLGEQHIDVKMAELKNKYGVEVELDKPRIPYRETIKGTSKAEGKYKKQTGGRGQFGVAWLRLEPNERGEGFEFLDEIVGGAIPSKFIPAVEKGIVERMERGVIAGYPVVDVKVAVYDGKYHSVDSSEMAFKMAGSIGFRLAAEQAKPTLLEPIYQISVAVPDEYLGDVMSDVSSRRGKIRETGQEGRFQVVKALVPLAELHKYSTHLRSITQGRGFFEMEFSHYEEVPGDVQAKVVAESSVEADEE